MTDNSVQHNPSTRPKHRRKHSHGQSIVEFALVLPLMLLFLAIAADFGRAYTAYLTVSSSAREGAIYAARSTENADNETEIIARAEAEVGNGGTIWNDPITVDPGPCATADPQGYRCVQVTVEYTFTPFFPIGPIPNEVDMQRTVSMRVLGN